MARLEGFEIDRLVIAVTLALLTGIQLIYRRPIYRTCCHNVRRPERKGEVFASKTVIEGKRGKGKEYERFLLQMPSKIAKDSQFCFKAGQDLTITADPKGKIALTGQDSSIGSAENRRPIGGQGSRAARVQPQGKRKKPGLSFQFLSRGDGSSVPRSSATPRLR
ncbi:MAG: hypothetical protein OEW84_08980 [Aigarchaeota archaeon]|nr:hypothetical protein [Aigarchaeota archaeon]